MKYEQATLFVTDELLRDSQPAAELLKDYLRDPEAHRKRNETYGFDREPIWYDEHDEPIEPLRLIVTAEGNVKFVWDDELAPLLALGKGIIGRASHVEPVGTLWFADLAPVGGPLLGPFRWRSDALDAEQSWLNGNPASPVCINAKP